MPEALLSVLRYHPEVGEGLWHKLLRALTWEL